MVGKTCVIIGILLLVSLAAFACAPAQQTPTVAPKAAEATQVPAPSTMVKPVTVKYGTLKLIGEAGVSIAFEKGYFKEQGIDLEMVPMRTPSDMVAPLSTGELNIGASSLQYPLMAAADRGIDMKIEAAGSQDVPGMETAWVVLRKDVADSGKVKTAADQNGMRFATGSRGSLNDIVHNSLPK